MRSNNVGCSIVAEIHQSNMARISSSAHASIALGAGEIVPDASYFQVRSRGSFSFSLPVSSTSSVLSSLTATLQPLCLHAIVIYVFLSTTFLLFRTNIAW